MLTDVNNIDMRIRLIGQMVRKDSFLADVGCDHGILITTLCNENIIKGGLALDINEMPLQKARLKVMNMGLSKKIKCIKTDGLHGINENEVDDIVIAGMGGELIFKIISECKWSKNPKKRFILQPMTKIPLLRQLLLKTGYKILREETCIAANKHYCVLNVAYCGKKENRNEFDSYIYIGELKPPFNNDSLEYIDGQINMLLKKANGIKNSDPISSKKYFETIAEIKKITGRN